MKTAVRFTIMTLLLFALLIGVFICPFPGFIGLAILLALIGFYDLFQKKHAILRNFPLIGPELHPYFVESDTDGKPIDRNYRDYI